MQPGPAAEGLNTLSLELQEVTGDLEFNRIQIQENMAGGWTVDAERLSDVGGKLIFSELQQLAMPRFPMLNSVTELSFNDVGFTPEFVNYAAKWPQLSQVTTLNLINTSLSSFGPFALSLSPEDTASGTTINITGNQDLRNVTINGYGNSAVFVRVDVHDNAANPSVSFPLMTGGSFNISGVSGISVPGVQTLGSQYSEFETQTISSNTFTTLDLSNVSTIYGTVEIVGNSALTILDLSTVGTVNNLEITNNPDLATIKLDNLGAIYTSLEINGPIDK